MFVEQYKRVIREKVLSDCRPDHAFWTCHGRVIRNIYELADTIESLNEWSFLYHVNADNMKNDFSKWIDEVLEDPDLALRLKFVRDKKEYVRIIRARIAELENPKAEQ